MSTFPDWRYQNPMSTTNPKQKVELSKQFASGYTLSNAMAAEGSIDNVFTQLLDWLDRFAESGRPMALDRFVTFTTFDLLGEVLFSKPFGYLAAGDDIGGSIATTGQLVGIHALVSHFRGIQLLALNPWTTKFMPWGHLFNTAARALDDRRRNPDTGRFDIVAHWLRTAAKNPDRLTDRQLLANTVANVGAGSDTVSNGMQAFLYYMARHPRCWERVRAEIRDAQDKEGRCRSRIISYQDAVALPFLQACIKEALRVHPSVPMGLPRIVPSGGLLIGDKRLPEGTTVSVSPWVIHHSKEIFGPDAVRRPLFLKHIVSKLFYHSTNNLIYSMSSTLTDGLGRTPVNLRSIGFQ